MQKVNVVTGAAGHIGMALLMKLAEKGEYVRALALNENEEKFLRGRADEIVLGDVRDAESIEKCFSGADTVFHLAGVIAIGRENKKLLRSVNVDGTKNVVNVCRKCGVKRLVYTSSVHAIDYSENNEILKEKEYYDPKKVVGAYAKTKAEAADIVLSANGNGLETVVCMPSGVTGPYAYKRSNIGQLIINYAKGKLPAYFDGKYNYVDSRDVATAIARAAEVGRAGESYVLSGEVCSLSDMLGKLEEITGRKKPVKLKTWFIKLIAPFAEAAYRMRKAVPLFTPYSLYTLTSNCNFDNSKAKRELNFMPRSVTDSISDEYNFMRAVEPDSMLTKKQLKDLKKKNTSVKKLRTAKSSRRR